MSLGFAKPGAFRVLLWKEWRQQRWTLAGMLSLALGLFVLGGCLEERWSFGLSGAAFLLVLLGVPLVLSARAFAGEDEDGTAVFLSELPFRPLLAFAVKFLVVVLASWGAAGLLLLLGRLWTEYPDNAMMVVSWAPHDPSIRLGPVVPIAVWLVAPVATSQASLLATLDLRSLTTALLNSLSLYLCVCWGAVSVHGLEALRALRPLWELAIIGVPCLAAGVAAGLSARRHPRKLVQVLRGAGGCVAVPALFLLPGALSHAYLNVLATPTFYVRSAWWHGSLGWVNASSVPPSSRPAAVALECELDRSRGVSRLALLDLSTGRTVWAGVRPAPMDFGSRAAIWSPDGSRVTWGGLVRPGTTATFAWKSGRDGGLPRRAQGAAIPRAELRVYDLRTQRTIRLPDDLAADMLEQGRNSWYNNTWMAAPWMGDPSRIGIAFVNTDDGSAHVCPVLSVEPGEEWAQRPGMVVLPDRAVFTAAWRRASGGGAEGLVIARCTPSAAAATPLLVSDPPPSAMLAGVSPEAQWALLSAARRDKGEDRFSLGLVDLETGATRPVALPPEAMEHMAKARHWPPTAEFVTGGARVLVDLRGTYAVYDLSRAAWQIHAPPVPGDIAADGWGKSVSPNGERAMQVFPPHAGRAAPQAVILDLVTGQWTTVLLGLPGVEPSMQGNVVWCGNDHLLAQDDRGIWRFGLDGSQQLLYPCTARPRFPVVVERPAGARPAELALWCREALEEEP